VYSSKSRLLLLSVFAFLTLCAVPQARAEDASFTTMGSQSDKDPRQIFKQAVLHKIIEETKDKYGPMEIKSTDVKMERDRELEELAKGDLIQVVIEVSRPDWEEKVTPIYIPVDKGLMGWKIHLIRKESQDTLDKVQTLGDYKKVSVGGAPQWTSMLVLKSLGGYNLVTGDNYDGLFQMLMSGRFDMFQRGLNEVYAEYDAHKTDNPDLAIEKNLVLVMPSPLYVFVTPKRPELAKRFQDGLAKMVEDGSLDKIIDEQFGSMIKSADLQHRRIFYVDNPLLTPKTKEVVGIKKYWFHL
jgi:hypothetical protein